MARSRHVTAPPQRTQSAKRKAEKGSTTATTVMRRSKEEARGCSSACELVTRRRMLTMASLQSAEDKGFTSWIYHQPINSRREPAPPEPGQRARRGGRPMSARGHEG